MGEGDGFLDGFRRELQANAALDGNEIATRLCRDLAAECERLKLPIADLWRGPLSAEFELENGAMWCVECLGVNAYHVYPARIREDGDVVWPNIWVAPDMTLDEMIAQIQKQVFPH
jgi:hypothetical protein